MLGAIIIIPILQIRKLDTEIKELGQCPTGS